MEEISDLLHRYIHFLFRKIHHKKIHMPCRYMVYEIL